MSCVTFHSSLTVQSRQLIILTNRIAAFWMCFHFDTSQFGHFIVYWSVENMTPDMTLYRIDVIVKPTKDPTSINNNNINSYTYFINEELIYVIVNNKKKISL